MTEFLKLEPRFKIRDAIVGLFLLAAPACVGGEDAVGKGSATEAAGSTGMGSTEEGGSTSSGGIETSTGTTASQTEGSTTEMPTVTGDGSSSEDAGDGTDTTTTGGVEECIPVHCGDFEELACGDPNENPLSVEEVLELTLTIPHPRHLDLCDPDAFPEYCPSKSPLEQALYLRMITEKMDLSEKVCMNWVESAIDRANHISPEEWSPVHFATKQMGDYSVKPGQNDVILAEYYLGGTNPDKSGQLTMVYSDLEGKFGDEDNGVPPISNVRMRCEMDGQMFFSEPADYMVDSGWINPPKLENLDYPDVKGLPCILLADIDLDAEPETVIRVGLADPLPGIYTPMFGPYEPPFITIE